MKIFYTKAGYVVSPSLLVRVLTRIADLRKAGFRKGFALKLAGNEQGLTAGTARQIWADRATWMRTTR